VLPTTVSDSILQWQPAARTAILDYKACGNERRASERNSPS
jgi:hypothetical protein